MLRGGTVLPGAVDSGVRLHAVEGTTVVLANGLDVAPLKEVSLDLGEPLGFT